MAKWHTLQNSFLEGEVSPRYVASINTELRQNALAQALNAITLLQGNVTKRMGTNFVIETGAFAQNTARLWPFFDINNRQAVTLWTEGQVQVVSTLDQAPDLLAVPDKAILSGYTQVVTNPYFALGLTGWNTLGSHVIGTTTYNTRAVSGDVILLEATVITFLPSELETQYIRQPIVVAESTNSIIYSFSARSISNADATKIRARVKIGTTPGGNEIVETVHDITETLNTISQSVIIPGGIVGQLYCELAMVVEDLDGGFINNLQNYRISAAHFLVYVQTDDVLIPAKLTTPYTDRDLESLHFIQSPFNDDENNQDLLVLHPNHPPYTLNFDGGVGNYVFEVFVFLPPEGTLWTPNNQPSIAAEFQGRLMLSGAVNTPETIWGSASFKWNDFSDVGAPTDEDAIEFTSTSRGVNTWLSGFKRFLYGNTSDEFDLAIEGRVLTPSDIGVQQQSSYGSERNPQKITIGNSIVLTTGGNTTIRMLRFSEENGGFVSPDVMLKAEHLGRAIIRRHFHTRDPHEMLWCVMGDGSMSVMSFDEQSGINAWTHFVTDGRFIDGVSITDQAGRDVVILVVERVIDGVTVKYLETITDLRNLQNWQYTDSTIRIFMNTDDLIVGGLGHLEAKEVDVFTDDNYLGKRVVVNGSIAIDTPANFVDVGLGYNFRAVTLPDGAVTPQTGLTAKKRYSKIGIRGIFSRGPIINGQRPPERSPTAIMDIPQPAELLLNTSVVDMDWSENATVTIEEPLPLRITIAGIFGKLTSNEV